MPLWQWLVDSAGLLLLLAAVLLALLVLRRRFLARSGGTFELSVRDPRRPVGQGWVLGLGRYSADSLEWFRIFSPMLRPRLVWRRNDLRILQERPPEPQEQHSLYAGSVVVRCATRDGEVELAMAPSSLTGLRSWLEAGPPGSRPSR